MAFQMAIPIEKRKVDSWVSGFEDGIKDCARLGKRSDARAKIA